MSTNTLYNLYVHQNDIGKSTQICSHQTSDGCDGEENQNQWGHSMWWPWWRQWRAVWSLALGGFCWRPGNKDTLTQSEWADIKWRGTLIRCAWTHRHEMKNYINTMCIETQTWNLETQKRIQTQEMERHINTICIETEENIQTWNLGTH